MCMQHQNVWVASELPHPLIFWLESGFLEINRFYEEAARERQENGMEALVLQPVRSLAEPRVIGSN